MLIFMEGNIPYSKINCKQLYFNLSNFSVKTTIKLHNINLQLSY